jgi:hypothetical protein
LCSTARCGEHDSSAASTSTNEPLDSVGKAAGPANESGIGAVQVLSSHSARLTPAPPECHVYGSSKEPESRRPR